MTGADASGAGEREAEVAVGLRLGGSVAGESPDDSGVGGGASGVGGGAEERWCASSS
jgi:hypothetical protein